MPALPQSIDQLILMRFLHGLSAASSVVINALMRDSYSKENFSRMMSFVMLINSRAVRRFGPLAMFRLGLLIQFSMGIWLLVVSALNLGFLPLVFGVAMFIGCVSTISFNAMAVILDEFPHMAGTASSLARYAAFRRWRTGGCTDVAGKY